MAEKSDHPPSDHESEGEAADGGETEEGGQQLEKAGGEKYEAEDSAPSGESEKASAQAKREERLRRLRELHMRRNEARKLNHAEVVEEDKRNKLPTNWEAKRRKIDWEVADEEARKQAEEAGEDYERVKLLEASAAELDGLERRRKRKNPDPGFADYAQAQHRQYERLTKQMEPDMVAYEKQKREMGEDFYPGVDSLVHGGSGKVSQVGIDRMVTDLEKQIEKRAKFSRRRAFDDQSDVDYINERNMKFNKKAARFYDKYTSEIKQNLERGTAI